jgi:hypothetical protein
MALPTPGVNQVPHGCQVWRQLQLTCGVGQVLAQALDGAGAAGQRLHSEAHERHLQAVPSAHTAREQQIGGLVVCSQAGGAAQPWRLHHRMSCNAKQLLLHSTLSIWLLCWLLLRICTSRDGGAALEAARLQRCPSIQPETLCSPSCSAHHGQAAVLDLLDSHAGAVHASGVEGELVDEAGLGYEEEQQQQHKWCQQF